MSTLLNQITFDLKNSFPHAWAKAVAAAPGIEAAVAATADADDTIAATLLRSLRQAAPSGNYPGSTSPARAAFEAQLAVAARQLARADGLSGPRDLAGLRARRVAALASTTLSPGQKRVAELVTFPAEPPEQSFADALQALRVFYGV